jgi:tRNA threonylcarbamoyladenosine biosynthesis protein TsaB
VILSIDTSTTGCSVALHNGHKLLACYELFTERTSSSLLTTLINNVVQHVGHQLADLDAIAVAKGPGSYTGLRIAVATAKGLCFALDKPLLAINTLQAMTEQIRHYSSLERQPGLAPYWNASPVSLLFCPMIDARRMEVYCALYDAEGVELMPTTAKVIDDQSFASELERGAVLFFGDGAAKCRPMLSQHPNACFLEPPIHPSARTVGVLAYAAFLDGRFEDVATFEPFYLKEFMSTQKRMING